MHPPLAGGTDLKIRSDHPLLAILVVVVLSVGGYFVHRLIEQNDKHVADFGAFQTEVRGSFNALTLTLKNLEKQKNATGNYHVGQSIKPYTLLDTSHGVLTDYGPGGVGD